MDFRNIIVIGGSAGAGRVLREVLSALPKDLAASLFVVTHFQANGPEGLRNRLAETSALPVRVAVDGEPVQPAHVYLCAADRHLLLLDGVIALGFGPKQNMMRPAIDPLFRSAALVYGPRVVGLVLSGYLDDGATGLAAVKARGGVALVQHPLDAEVASMPEAALAATEVDRALHDEEIAGALAELAMSEAPKLALPPDPALDLEVRIAAGRRIGAVKLEDVARPTTITCPECHGVLSEMTTGPLRYRCQTGHAFGPETALSAQQPGVDEALLLALRLMEERCSLVKRMAADARAQGRNATAELYESRATEFGRYAAILREAAQRALMSPAEGGLPP